MRVGERGFTLVAMLVFLALMMVGAALAGPTWSHQVQRERELELVRIGSIYAQAIRRYRDMSPGSDKSYPARLEDLLLDGRFVSTMRHLRTLYADPMSPGKPWVEIHDASGRIIGVRSSSRLAALSSSVGAADGIRLPTMHRYADWQFLAKDVR